MLTATVVRGGQDEQVQKVFAMIADATRTPWHRAGSDSAAPRLRCLARRCRGLPAGAAVQGSRVPPVRPVLERAAAPEAPTRLAT